MELEDAVHTAILTLKEGFEGQMTESSIEIGIAYQTEKTTSEGEIYKTGVFRRLEPSEIKDYLANIA